MKEKLKNELIQMVDETGESAVMMGFIIEPIHEKRTVKIRFISICGEEDNERFYRTALRLYFFAWLYLLAHRIFSGKVERLMAKRDNAEAKA